MTLIKEKPFTQELKTNQEALEKIKGLKKNFPDEIAKLFPEIKKETLKDWKEKRHRLELKAVETGQDLYFEDLYEMLYAVEAGFDKEDQLDKKFLKKFKPELVREMRDLIKERLSLDEKIIQAAQAKNDQEILASAEDGYKFLIQEALNTDNLKYKINTIQIAYDGAKKFLGSKWQENALQVILDEYIKNAPLFTNKEKTEITLFIKREILELMYLKKEKTKSLKLAQDFEKAGLLDIERDKDIFEKLTK